MPEIPAIPGLGDLWERTRGDPRVRVALIDGPPDLTHPCFEGAAIESLDCPWLGDEEVHDLRRMHGTFILGMLVGRHDCGAPGIAPGCTAVVVPAIHARLGFSDPLHIARALEAAVRARCDVIVFEGGLPSPSGDGERLLRSVVRDVERAGVLLVAPAGNEDDCRFFPQVLPEVLVVGGHDDDGVMGKYSGWGPEYSGHGIVAPSENITSAEPGGGLINKHGTSCAAPIVGGVAALFLSLELMDGRRPSPLAVRRLLLETAQPCTDAETLGEPGRCLAGKLDIRAAIRRFAQSRAPQGPPAGVAGATTGVTVSEYSAPTGVTVSEYSAPTPGTPTGPVVYALGSLGFDFGTQARRDAFKQLMPPVDVDGTVVPANPHNAGQLVDHLAQYPSEAEALIWTVNIELTPIYAIGPIGAHAPRVFELLVALLAAEYADADDGDRVERVAIPGRLTGRSVRLLSRQVVPVVEIDHARGIHGWRIAALAQAALAYAGRAGTEEQTRRVLGELLTRVYFELRNLGLTARDRALNFAATNAFQAADALVSAVAAGLTLAAIDVEASDQCRPGSDCWEVTLRFFDPENLRRARRVSRFTVDVGDIVPVTLGAVRTWSEAPARKAPATGIS